jgi:hypothetical protein
MSNLSPAQIARTPDQGGRENDEWPSEVYARLYAVTAAQPCGSVKLTGG